MRALCLTLLLAACTNDAPAVRVLTPEISVTPPAVEAWTDPVETLGPVPGSLPVDAIVGETVTAELFVANSGRADLDVRIAIDGDAFTIDTTQATIAADGLQTFVVTFSPSDLTEYTGTLTLQSNDEDSPSLDIPLRGNGIAPPTPDIDVNKLTIDFGDVDFGDSALDASAVMVNAGTAPLTVGTMLIEGSPAFRLQAPFTPGAQLGVGSNFPIVLVYEPLFPGQGDNGTLVIPSDDPDEPETRVALIGNDGGDFEYPQAVIDCPGTVEITGPQDVVLDGGASSDPAGLTPLTYTWDAVRVPNGSSTELYVAESLEPTVALPVDVGGAYEVLLTVHNSDGTPSAAASCVVDVVPADQIRVELSWDGPNADLDLHLLETPETELWAVPGDACSCNPNPEWGATGPNDDPRVSLDDRDGYGPENINIEAPADGAYAVRVNYFAAQGDSTVTATVKVWADGEKVWEGRQPLDYKDVWDVGLINWPEGTFAASDAPIGTDTVRQCQD